MTSCGAPEQKIKLRVTDESGKPLEGVDCMAGFTLEEPNGKWKDTSDKRKSGPDGIVELQGETLRCETLVRATAPGYYKSEIYRYLMTGKAANRWEPWPVEVDLVMKKIVKPHPMYAVKPNDKLKFVLPEKGEKTVGFDLLKMDWIAPHGKGQQADFLLEARRDSEGAAGHFPPGTMTVTFSNAADGIQPVASAALGGSLLVSPQIAPEGGYVTTCRFSSHPLQDGQFPGIDLDRRVWVFRIRTVTDRSGRVVSAHYGKIQAAPEVLFFATGPAFRMTYYVNAEPNEKWLEWDMKTNLFKDLDRRNWPDRP